MSLPHSSRRRKSNPLSDHWDHSESDQSPDPRSIDQCALLTGTGRSAIAVIGLRGRRANRFVKQCFRPASAGELEPGQVRYGNWCGADDAEIAGESVIVTPIDRDHFEIHCHGGPAAIARILGNLQSCGVMRIETADWHEPGNRLVQEARRVLSECLTERTAAIAMDQVRGALANWVAGWIRTIEQSERGDSVDIRSTNGLADLRRQADQILAHAAWTSRMTDPFRVVLTGPPNVGKSSLLNAIVGYDRSITFDQAGTTRDVLHSDTVIDGLPIRLSDTAGIRRSDQPIEQEGIARAIKAVDQADLVLTVVSPESEPWDLPDIRWDAPTASPTTAARPTTTSSGQTVAEHQPRLVLVNKLDLIQPDFHVPPDAWFTNALTGQGVPEVMAAIADTLAKSMPEPAAAVPVNQRQVGRLRELGQSETGPQALRILADLWGGRPSPLKATE